MGVIMSDSLQTSPPKHGSIKYDPTKDAPRMKIYMAHKRAKEKAGFRGTVKEWLAYQTKITE